MFSPIVDRLISGTQPIRFFTLKRLTQSSVVVLIGRNRSHCQVSRPVHLRTRILKDEKPDKSLSLSQQYKDTVKSGDMIDHSRTWQVVLFPPKYVGLTCTFAGRVPPCAPSPTNVMRYDPGVTSSCLIAPLPVLKPQLLSISGSVPPVESAPPTPKVDPDTG